MRTLVLFFILVGSAFAETELRLGSSFQNLPVSLQALSSVSAPNVSSFKNTFFVKSNRIKGKDFNLQAQLDQSFLHYEGLEFRNSEMQITRLQGNTHRTEYFGALNVEWETLWMTTRIGVQGHLGNVLFPVRGAHIGQAFSFFNQATKLDWDYQYIDQKRPEDFFVNRDLRVQKRATEINTHRVVLGAEQTLTERYKVRTEGVFQHKVNERPQSYGFVFKNAYAASSRLFFQLEGARFLESRSAPLINERGRFSAWITKASVSVEPFVDFLLTGSYGLTFEREEFSDTGIIEQLASDQYALGLKYSWKSYSADLKGSLIRTNINTQSTQVEGGLSWAL